MIKLLEKFIKSTPDDLRNNRELFRSCVHIADGFDFHHRRQTQALVIYIASPRRVKRTDTHKKFAKFYMGIWEKKEIIECNEAFYHVERTLLDKLFDWYGGVPRYLLEKASVEKIGTKTDVLLELETAISKCNPFTFMQLVRNVYTDLSLSHKFIHYDVDEYFKIKRYRFASDKIAKAIAHHYLKVKFKFSKTSHYFKKFCVNKNFMFQNRQTKLILLIC